MNTNAHNPQTATTRRTPTVASVAMTITQSTPIKVTIGILLGIAAPVITGGVGFLMSAHIDHETRLAKIEAAEIERKAAIDARLSRIEALLDRLLDRKP